MKNKIKNRIGMICVLLATGFVLAVIGNAIGAGAVFQGSPKIVETDIEIIVTDDQAVTYENGELVENITFSKETQEDGVFIIDDSSGMLQILRVSKEEADKIHAEEEAERNKSIEIALKDSAVQELVVGKKSVSGREVFLRGGWPIDDANPQSIQIYDDEYLMMPIRSNPEGQIMDLQLAVKDVVYSILIDTKNEMVISIVDYGEMRKNLLEIAKNDSTTQGLINRKENAVPAHRKTIDTGVLHTSDLGEKKNYEIEINMSNKSVTSVTSWWVDMGCDGKMNAKAEAEMNETFEIAMKDDKVQELIEGKEYKYIAALTHENITDDGESNIKTLILEVEGKTHEIIIDEKSETVISIG